MFSRSPCGKTFRTDRPVRRRPTLPTLLAVFMLSVLAGCPQSPQHALGTPALTAKDANAAGSGLSLSIADASPAGTADSQPRLHLDNRSDVEYSDLTIDYRLELSAGQWPVLRVPPGQQGRAELQHLGASIYRVHVDLRGLRIPAHGRWPQHGDYALQLMAAHGEEIPKLAVQTLADDSGVNKDFGPAAAPLQVRGGDGRLLLGQQLSAPYGVVADADGRFQMHVDGALRRSAVRASIPLSGVVVGADGGVAGVRVVNIDDPRRSVDAAVVDGIDSARFTVLVPLLEGSNHLQIQSRDEAGHLRVLPLDVNRATPGVNRGVGTVASAALPVQQHSAARGGADQAVARPAERSVPPAATLAIVSADRAGLTLTVDGSGGTRYVYSNRIALSGRVTGANNGVAVSTIHCDRYDYVLPLPLDGNGFFSVEVPVLSGFNVLNLYVQDGDGRRAQQRVDVFAQVMLDSTAPQLQFDAGQAGPVAGDSITLNGVVSDSGSGVARVVAVDSVGDGQSVDADLHEDGHFSVTLPLQVGINPLTVTAYDYAGNTAALQVSITRNPPPDVTPPNLSLDDGADRNTSDSSIVLQGNADDAQSGISGVSVVNDSLPEQGFIATLQGNGRFSVEVALLVGANVLHVVAVDAAGNRSERILTVTRDAVPPQLLSLTPASGTHFVATPLSVSGEFVAEGSAPEDVLVEFGDLQQIPMPAADAVHYRFLFPEVSLMSGLNSFSLRLTALALSSEIAVEYTLDDVEPPTRR